MTSLALKDAIDSRLNYRFFFIKLNCVLFAQCIIFCRTNRAHWRSVIDSQLFMIKNKPTNSQRSKMTYLEDNFAISPDFLHFPTLKVLHSTEGNFLFGSSHCSWDHLVFISLRSWRSSKWFFFLLSKAEDVRPCLRALEINMRHVANIYVWHSFPAVNKGCNRDPH